MITTVVPRLTVQRWPTYQTNGFQYFRTLQRERFYLFLKSSYLKVPVTSGRCYHEVAFKLYVRLTVLYISWQLVTLWKLRVAQPSFELRLISAVSHVACTPARQVFVLLVTCLDKCFRSDISLSRATCDWKSARPNPPFVHIYSLSKFPKQLSTLY